MAIRFGDAQIDRDRRELRRGGKVVHVEPKVFDLLLVLIDNRERVVTKDELLETVWEGRTVSETALSSGIKAARKALGDTGESQTFIKTISTSRLSVRGRPTFRHLGPVIPR